jgi:hypothetical protein
MVLRVRPPYLLEFVVAMAVCAFVAARGGLPRIPAADQYARRAGSRQHDLIRNAPIPSRSHEASGPSATTRTQAACRPAVSGQRGERGGRSQIAAPRQLGGNAGDRTRRRGNAGPGGQAAGAPGGEALPARGIFPHGHLLFLHSQAQIGCLGRIPCAGCYSVPGTTTGR